MCASMEKLIMGMRRFRFRLSVSLWSRDRDSLQAQGRAEVANVAKLQASSEVWNGEPTCGTRVFATQHSGEMTRSIGTT